MRERPGTQKDEMGRICLDFLSAQTSEQIRWWNDYADEADRLATLEVIKRGKKHWGRWYLDGGCLCTMTSRPSVGESPAWAGEEYWFELSRCKTPEEQKQWLEHMKEKNWMGEKGLADLAKAFKALNEREGK